MSFEYHDDMEPGDWRGAQKGVVLSKASLETDPLPTAGDWFRQNWRDTTKVSNQDATIMGYHGALNEVNDKIHAATGKRLVNPMDWNAGSAMDVVRATWLRGRDIETTDSFQAWRSEVDALRKAHPDALDWDEMIALPGKRTFEAMKAVRERTSEMSDRFQLAEPAQFPGHKIPIVGGFVSGAQALAYNAATSPIRTGTQLAANIAASFTSPIDASVNLLGFGAAGKANSVLKAATANAVTNAVGQLPLSYLKQKDYEAAGLPHGWDVIGEEVAGAAAGGFVLDAAVRGAARGVRKLRGTDAGQGGLIFDAVPQPEIAPRPQKMADISPETIDKASKGDLAATREILEKTGAIEDPATRGALEHMETVGKLDAEALARLDAMGVARSDGMRVMDNLMAGRYAAEPDRLARDIERMRSPAEPALSDVDVARVMAAAGPALDAVAPRLSAMVERAVDARIPAVEALVRRTVAALKEADAKPDVVAKALADDVGKLLADPEQGPKVADALRLTGTASTVEMAAIVARRPDLKPMLNPEIGRHAEALAMSRLAPDELARVAAGEVPGEVAAHIAETVPAERHAQAFDDIARERPASVAEAKALLDELAHDPGERLPKSGENQLDPAAEVEALRTEAGEAAAKARAPMEEREALSAKVETLRGEIAKLEEKAANAYTSAEVEVRDWLQEIVDGGGVDARQAKHVLDTMPEPGSDYAAWSRWSLGAVNDLQVGGVRWKVGDIVAGYEERALAARKNIASDSTAITQPTKPSEQKFADPETGEPMTAEDVDAIVDMWRYVNETGRIKQPQRLSAFLIDQGRIRDENGEVSSFGAKNLISGKGLSLDDAALRAWEAGFFEGVERPTISDLLNLIADDVGGHRVVRVADRAILDDIATMRQMETDLDQFGIRKTDTEDGIRAKFREAESTRRSESGEAPARGTEGEKLYSIASDAGSKARAERAGFDTSTVYYHGTRQSFDAFDPAGVINKRAETQGSYWRDRPRMVFLSDDPDLAGFWASGEDGRMIPTYLKRDVRLFDGSKYADEIAAFLTENESTIRGQLHSMASVGDDLAGAIRRGSWEVVETPAVQQWLRDNGYDGFKAKTKFIAGKDSTIVAVFDTANDRGAVRSVNAQFSDTLGPKLMASFADLAKKRAELHEAETRLAELTATTHPDPAGAAALYRIAMDSIAERRQMDVIRAVQHALALGRRMLPEGTKVEALPDEQMVHVGKDGTRYQLDGSYERNADLVRIAIHAIDPSAKMGHEAVHALVAHGLLTADEVKALAALAREAGVLKPDDEARYREAYKNRDGLDALIDEEAAAALIEARIKGDAKGPENTIVERIRQFLERLKALLDGYGFRSREDIVRAIIDGDVAQRRVAVAEGKAAMAEAAAKGVTLPNGTQVNGVPLFSIRAFHGSPHDFDRFDMRKIGSGEGAQAFGHGLYFAESEGVARSYQNRLSAPPGQFNWMSTRNAKRYRFTSLPGDGIPKFHDDAQIRDFLTDPQHLQDMHRISRISVDLLRKEIADLEKGRSDRLASSHERFRAGIEADYGNRIRNRQADLSEAEGAATELDAFVTGGMELKRGTLYEVRINAEPDQFLDWDKPLSEQSEKVRALFPNVAPDTPGSELMRAAQGLLSRQPPKPTGDTMRDFISQQMFQQSARDYTKKGASEDALKSAGIAGIAYLDRGSRGKGEGTRNYVVFDDNLIEILRKYGIGGILAGGAGAAGIGSLDESGL